VAEQQVLAEREQLHARLAELCQMPLAEWRQRAARIQARVESISERVNQRRLSKAAEAAAQQQAERTLHASSLRRLHWGQRLLEELSGALWPEPQSSLPPPIVIAEELDAHAVVAELSLEAVAEIGAHPEKYPGVEIVPQWRRRYPAGTLASHIIGHLGAPPASRQATDSPPAERVGRMGVEHHYERQLHGASGLKVEVIERDGTLVSARRQREPTVGRDLVLSLDLALQRAAESLLDSACQRRDALAEQDRSPAGGAIVALDVHSGAILAAASAPRFDPNLFSAAASGDESRQVAALLADPAHPLFDRTSRMALPPGSVFKPLTAIALLSSGVSAEQTTFCRGYWRDPKAMRCAIFTRSGIGHGDVDLQTALTQSCNVYFFDAASHVGPGPLVDWARRLGFRQPTGVYLASETSGHLPDPALDAVRWRTRDTQSLSIGQSSLTASPLQIARFMAAIANGGSLVTPHFAERFGVATDVGADSGIEQGHSRQLADDLPLSAVEPIRRLDPQVLEPIRAGLTSVVASEQGTAHATVHLDGIAIAGKTGTAQAGGDRPDHAWFAGYCPAEAPKVALVVVLEHGGDGGSVAGPVARRLVERMLELGYFNRRAASRR
jgi:penicillin-binding protein 2